MLTLERKLGHPQTQLLATLVKESDVPDHRLGSGLKPGQEFDCGVKGHTLPSSEV